MSDSKTDPMKRLLQIFSARLVLEVFGGGGAIWGFSEVITFRNPDTQETWRTNASIVAAIFFVRFLLQIKDYVMGMNGQTVSYDDDKSSVRLFQVFSARLVLEVFGGGGAIWGFSEALTLRNPETQEFWRLNASIVAAIFFVRFCLQIKDFVTGYSPLANDKSFLRFLQIFSAKIVLEVFGAAGAIWGFSEVCTLRRPETQSLWRFNALTVGAIFFIRFLLQIKDHVLQVNYGECHLDLTHDQYLRLVQIYSAKLVLEVFGGAGAIWGFSEACTLRNPDTQQFWRFNALTVGAIFFVRFLHQIKDSIMELKGPIPDLPSKVVDDDLSLTEQTSLTASATPAYS